MTGNIALYMTFLRLVNADQERHSSEKYRTCSSWSSSSERCIEIGHSLGQATGDG